MLGRTTAVETPLRKSDTVRIDVSRTTSSAQQNEDFLAETITTLADGRILFTQTDHTGADDSGLGVFARIFAAGGLPATPGQHVDAGNPQWGPVGVLKDGNHIEQKIVTDFGDGGGSAKMLLGGNGNDSVIGYVLADTMDGGAGEHRLERVAGDDSLTGGRGRTASSAVPARTTTPSPTS